MSRRGTIAWFATNPVAANSLALVVCLLGLLACSGLRVALYPEFEARVVRVDIEYPGATPADVEDALLLPVEDALGGLPGVREMRSTARPELGIVQLEVAAGASAESLRAEVDARLRAIHQFPELARPPRVELEESAQGVIWLAVQGGDGSARAELARSVAEDLRALPELAAVDILGQQQREIAIEVSERALRAYGLTFDELAEAVRKGSRDTPAGTIRSELGDLRLRAPGQARTVADFGNILVRDEEGGARLRLGELAKVRETFTESSEFARFDGRPALNIRVGASGVRDELAAAAAVRSYVQERNATLPSDLRLSTWGDRSYYLQGRLDMMVGNLLGGALLVFLALALFLQTGVAFAVLASIPVCFLGTLALMYLAPWPVGIDLVSLFGFVLVIGILVDDGIVVAESVHATPVRAGGAADAVLKGVQRVAVPATFGVLTTIVAFLPLMFVGGSVGPLVVPIATVAIACLAMSMLESKWILPAHLLALRRREGHASRDPLRVPRQHCTHALAWLIERAYRPLLVRILRKPGPALAFALAGLAMVAGVALTGGLRVEMLPEIPSDFVQVQVQMHEGAARHLRDEALLRVEAQARAFESEAGGDIIDHIALYTRGDHAGQLLIELAKSERRAVDAYAFEHALRQQVGDLPGVRRIRYASTTNPGGGAPIEIHVRGDQPELVAHAARDLADALRGIEGLRDVYSEHSTGMRELQFRLSAHAPAGLGIAELGKQVRQAFHGEELQRLQRGAETLPVMLRYPPEERRSPQNLADMRVRAADGAELPFEEVAEMVPAAGANVIARRDRERSIALTADLDRGTPAATAAHASLRAALSGLRERHPGASLELAGASAEEKRMRAAMFTALSAAVLLVYLLLAVALRSWVKPLLVLAAIPVGVAGACVGHLLTGQPFSMYSAFGVVALAGVVVNDALVLGDHAERQRRAGESPAIAYLRAGTTRLRPILLTMLTTVLGLLPILFESSLQAQFVIPMATSLAFGVLFSAICSPLLIPALGVWLERRNPRLRVAAPGVDPLSARAA